MKSTLDVERDRSRSIVQCQKNHSDSYRDNIRKTNKIPQALTRSNPVKPDPDPVNPFEVSNELIQSRKT